MTTKMKSHHPTFQPFELFNEKYERKGRLRSVQTPKGVQIWQCVDKTSGEECSLKILKKNTSSDASQSFLQEIAILKECNGHPNLLDVRDTYECPRGYYMVTDSLVHPNILETLEDYKDDVGSTQVATIIRTLINALVFLHDSRNKSKQSNIEIYHGNIHPKNIVVPKGQTLDDLILVDFSNAETDVRILGVEVAEEEKMEEEDSDSDSSSSSSSDDEEKHSKKKKKKKKKGGRSPFHAPEFRTTGPTDKSDIWAVGVLTFLLLTGHYPFAKPADMKEGIKEWYGIDDPNCREFVSQLLEYNPRKRPSVKEINRATTWFNAEATLEGTMHAADLGEVMHRLTTIRKEHDFQIAVRSYIATKVLKKSDRDQFDQIFRMADENNNNTLSRREFEQALIKADIDFLDKDAIDSYFKLLDANDDHRISYTEFMAFVEDQQHLFEHRRLRAAFDAFDYDKGGTISAQDIMKFARSAGGSSAFTASGEKVLRTKTVQSMIERADKNGNGTISFDEFCDMMLGTDKARIY